MIFDIFDVKLSTVRGLLGNILPGIRAVCVDSKENLIKVCFYIDGNISEELKECCECTIDQVIADFCFRDEIEFETPIVRIDYPKKMSLIGEWVYYRHEDSSGYCVRQGQAITEVSIRNLKLSIQRSLLGNIFTNLRAVCVNLKDSLIQIYFYHDKNISDKDLSLCKHALNQIIADFSHQSQNDSPIQFDTQVVRIDFPKEMPLIGQWIYYRCEDSSKYIE